MEVGIGSASMMTDIGYAVHIDSDIDSMGKAQAGSVLVPVHPEPSRHSSLSRCLLPSLS